MCARRECACAGAGALRTDSITEAGKKPSRKSRGGEADSVAAPRAYRRKIEIERIDPDCFLAFEIFREFSLMDFFFW